MTRKVFSILIIALTLYPISELTRLILIYAKNNLISIFGVELTVMWSAYILAMIITVDSMKY